VTFWRRSQPATEGVSRDRPLGRGADPGRQLVTTCWILRGIRTQLGLIETYEWRIDDAIVALTIDGQILRQRPGPADDPAVVVTASRVVWESSFVALDPAMESPLAEMWEPYLPIVLSNLKRLIEDA
jgi:hypothetical protein